MDLGGRNLWIGEGREEKVKGRERGKKEKMQNGRRHGKGQGGKGKGKEVKEENGPQHRLTDSKSACGCDLE